MLELVRAGEIADVLANDLREGTHTAAAFDDAVVRHRLLQAIEQAAASFSKFPQSYFGGN